ncbi:hypothetical protein DC345_09510 [Paenibacillus taichungensis]|uniref:Uncharacterized protein n=1 Tax=Paenibacillus taichungensis TaxID=484184 RepID=A0A329QYM1_9BACL|nr:hypothetical protein DC345_09510 [Paenibacillus taichungensis]
MRSKAERLTRSASLNAFELMRGLRSIILSAAMVSTALCRAKQGETTRSAKPKRNRAYARIAKHYPKRSDGLECEAKQGETTRSAKA